MDRRSTIGISAMTALGLALFPSGGVGQQKSMKEQLVGLGLSSPLNLCARTAANIRPLVLIRTASLFLMPVVTTASLSCA